MYKHLLVPVDHSTLSSNLVTQAVRYAGAVGAKITFFHAVRDYLATDGGALMHAMAPDIVREKIAGEAHVILNKAEAAARAAKVEADAVFKVGDDISQAIISAAEEKGCDLIYTMMRGPISIGPLSIGSQTFKLVAHSPIPVLIASVARNSPTPEMDKSIAIIDDEHRSLASVLHAAMRLQDESVKEGALPDFSLLKMMVFYIRKFPEALHHPKEEQYLFKCLRKRTRDADDALAVLQGQHDDRSSLDKLEQALTAYEAGEAGAATRFAGALETFCKEEFQHMTLEESFILPAARKHLTREDWTMIAAAFDENKIPSVDHVADGLFKEMFAKIMRDGSPVARITAGA